nr:DNA helicase PIF1, ATP-dependent [Tanacetum cinerariifolium]
MLNEVISHRVEKKQEATRLLSFSFEHSMSGYKEFLVVINHVEDTQFYLDVYRKYSRVYGKVSCVQQCMGLRGSSGFVRGVGDGLDKRKLKPGGVSNNGCSTSRRVRNEQVRPRLNSVVGVRSTSRRTSLCVLTSGGIVDSYSVTSAGTSYTYSDLGDCDRRCDHCGASFCYVERLKGNSHNQTPEYHLCCEGGRIQMQPPHELPEYIKNALAICQKLGNPQFFITFTCNVNWPEIKRFMFEYPHLTASDRADVVCRVFEQKIQALIAFLKEEHISRDVTGELMMHGPCRVVSLKAPCMKGDKYSKKFPKIFNQKTFFDENGHVHYRTGHTSVSATRNEFQLDNSYVVSYNCTDKVFTCVSRPITESSTTSIPSRQVMDEIQNYVEGCFICAHEAYWRILNFDIHRRKPAVQILAVHLEDMQQITFRDQD